MRSYLIDEISPPDIQKINQFLSQNALTSGLEKIFWVRIPDDLLSELQSKHKDCQPHYFAVEVGNNWIKLEFLIRNLKSMRCSCNCYCTHEQREFIFRYAHNMIETLGITT